MRKLLLGLTTAVCLATIPGQAQTRAPAEPSTGRCGEWVKWRAIVLDDNLPSFESTALGDLPVHVVEFWTQTDGPGKESATVAIATNGAFGTRFIDGHHNTTYASTFFPARQVVRARHEYDCQR